MCIIKDCVGKKKKDIEKNLHPKIAINNKGSFC